MPAKNCRKVYIENGIYHLYNRGVEKRNIFIDKQDYNVFLSYLKSYLTPKDVDGLQNLLSNSNLVWAEKNKFIKLLRLNNFSDEITMLAYCLMPNHFHFLVRQNSMDSIDKFINSLNTRYVMYFNKKYNRVGPLFQGVYKAVLISTDEQLEYLSAYIHRNPLGKTSTQLRQGEALEKCMAQPSSLPEYLGLKFTEWVKPKVILNFFSSKRKQLSYKNFVLSFSENKFNLTRIKLED